MRVTGSIKPSKSVWLIGVAGGSGSGKTHFAQDLQTQLGSEVCQILYQDSYYKDQSGRFDYDGGSVNFDHPDSLDFDLLAENLATLKRGEPIAVPRYDFVTHTRSKETDRMTPSGVILVDGILIFHPPRLRSLFDDRLFFDTPEDVRFTRRMHRDVKERGRTPEGVRTQFANQVKPMHDRFVEPTKLHARLIVNEESDYAELVATYAEELRRRLFD
ncbi:MAG: uridine kinase [Bdellovibrionales bacterium]